MEVQWGNDELGAHGCCWLCGFGDGGAQCAPISSTHQNFVLVILPLGREKKAKSYPQKLGGRGAQRVYMGVPVDARGGLGVSAAVPVGQRAVGWGWGVPGSLVGSWGRSIRSCRGAPRSLLGSGAGIGSYGGVPGSILAS